MGRGATPLLGSSQAQAENRTFPKPRDRAEPPAPRVPPPIPRPLLLLLLPAISPNLRSRAARFLDLLSSSIIMKRRPLREMLPAAGRTISFVTRLGTLSSGLVRPTFAFRQDGAAVPPAGAAAGALALAVNPDCMPLGLLEGLVCDAVVGPPDNSALYGTHYFPPECDFSAAPSTWRFLGSARTLQTLAS